MEESKCSASSEALAPVVLAEHVEAQVKPTEDNSSCGDMAIAMGGNDERHKTTPVQVAIFSPTRNADSLSADDHCSNAPRRLVFHSPRIHYSDAILFPAAAAATHRNRRRGRLSNAHSADDDDERMNSFQQQVIQHHGPPRHVLSLGARRCLTLETLQAGMPRQAARHVTELHLHFAMEQDWDAWWFGLGDIFVNVQHLHIKRATAISKNCRDESRDVCKPSEEQVNGNDNDGVFDGLQTLSEPFLEHDKIYFQTSQAERLAALALLPKLVSLNSQAFAADDYQAVNDSRPSPFALPAFCAPSPVISIPTTTCSLLDQEEDGMEDDDGSGIEIDDYDDEEDLDLEIEAIREILEATKSLDDADFATKSSVETKLSRSTPDELEEKKEDDCHAARAPAQNNADAHYELECVSPESNAVACEWGVACGSLSIPAYFQNSNGATSSSAACTRLRFRPRAMVTAPVTVSNDDEESGEERIRRLAVSGALLRNVQSTQTPYPDNVLRNGNMSDTQACSAGPPCTTIAPSVDDCAKDEKDNAPQLAVLNRDMERVPAHASLTSPFPMQFRARAKQVIFATKQRPTNDALTAAVADAQPEPCASEGVELLPSSLGTITDELLCMPIALANTKPSPLVIDTAVPRAASDEGPSNTRHEMQTKKSATFLNRPPPCPRRANLNVAPTAKRKFKKHRGTKWRDKVAARSNSIMDDSEEEDDDGSLENDIALGVVV